MIQNAGIVAQRRMPVESDSTSEQEEEPQIQEENQLPEDEDSIDEAEPKLLPAVRNEVRNKQMFFGGLPLN